MKLSTSHFCPRVFYHSTTFLKYVELLRWLRCQVICVLKRAKISRKAYNLHKSKYFRNALTDFTLQLWDVRIIIPFDARASFRFRNHFVCKIRGLKLGRVSVALLFFWTWLLFCFSWSISLLFSCDEYLYKTRLCPFTGLSLKLTINLLSGVNDESVSWNSRGVHAMQLKKICTNHALERILVNRLFLSWQLIFGKISHNILKTKMQVLIPNISNVIYCQSNT